jgi:hypothetical protein
MTHSVHGKRNIASCQSLPTSPIWIPIPRVGRAPSSTSGRKGSAAMSWSEEPFEDNEGCPGYQPDLLSGVGDQFTTAFGRRLSWLMWNDSSIEDAEGTGTHRR